MLPKFWKYAKYQSIILTVADLKRSEQFLEQMAQAMFAIKFQIGATGAISTSSALLADTANKVIKKKKE